MILLSSTLIPPNALIPPEQNLELQQRSLGPIPSRSSTGSPPRPTPLNGLCFRLQRHLLKHSHLTLYTDLAFLDDMKAILEPLALPE